LPNKGTKTTVLKRHRHEKPQVFRNRRLADFAYRVVMPWWIFALAGLLATVIAMLTVSVQSVRAATANPVDSLRSE
jgi:putative ABC transport system permease protein